MDTTNNNSTKQMMMIMWFFFCILAVSEAYLSENFYAKICPNVEHIVQQAVAKKYQETLVTAPGTLRLFFHDCFVDGCDASVFIASEKEDAEKNSPDDISLAGDGYDTVVKAKLAVEAKCPGLVSCADIIALAARDVVVLAGGPGFKVELGRRDGLVSKASRVDGKLPRPEQNVTGLVKLFASNGLSMTDMIALSGAHTLGFSHCDRFTYRLYNYSASRPVDPTLDPAYAKQLMQTCHRFNKNPDTVVVLDETTPDVFDNAYFKNLVARKGLLTSDQVLFDDILSRSTVVKFANNIREFNRAFSLAMRKLGRIGVKVGKQGEIRKDCSAFN